MRTQTIIPDEKMKLLRECFDGKLPVWMACLETSLGVRIVSRIYTEFRGTRKTEGAGQPVHLVDRICFAEGCLSTPTHGKFCETHKYKPPANVERLMAGSSYGRRLTPQFPASNDTGPEAA